MKYKIIPSLLILIFILSGFVTLGKSAPLAVGITSISPNSSPNNISTVLSITGIDFVDGAVVSLEGFGPLSTTYFSPTSLTAILPVGVPAGTYNVVVTLPDTSTASLPGALTVTLPISPTATASSVPSGTYERPLIVVHSYSTSASTIYPGQEFDLYVTIYNSGQHYARNNVASFTSELLLPRKTGGVGAIALLVAAIGIANTMTMAILERTREIGLMKAVGATNRDVLSIFLGEAAGIGFIGGIGGLVLGWSAAQILNVLAMSYLAGQAAEQGGLPPSVAVYTPAWLPIFALVFATLVGLLSGLYPALRAATLVPLNALKYE